MIIKSAKFIISNTNISKCPGEGYPEYAFIGRSNVGKSSLINMLTGHGKLAMTSSKPGKTQLINHFLINDSWFLVDLPGYGFAQHSKKTRDGFGKLIMDYIEQRKELTNLFVLIDGRLKPQAIDLEFVNSMGQLGIPLSIVFTKSDKLAKSKVKDNVDEFCEQLYAIWEELPPIFITSSTKKRGKDELLGYISDVNKSVKGTVDI